MSSKLIENIKNKFIIISAPSGAGKTTIVHRLLNKHSNLTFSVSATTRKPRINEIDGKDYYFQSEDQFLHSVAQKKFIEFEEVYPGLYYGTFFKEIERIDKLEKNIVFEIDVKGGLRLKKKMKEKAITIFICPPSIKELKNRLIERGKESEKNIETRIEKAQKELTYKNEYDYCFVNNDLEKCYAEVEKTIFEFIEKT